MNANTSQLEGQLIPGSQAGWAWCVQMLPRVSRTFALTIKLLPRSLQRTVTVSYLLCRVADTIEDEASGETTASAKTKLLGEFSATLETNDPAFLNELRFFVGDTESNDAELARKADLVLGEYFGFSEDIQARIRPWVQEMCSGMAQYVERGIGELTPEGVIRDLDDLERYCYYVAGTVGNLLTALFFGESGVGEKEGEVRTLGENFGLGLQLTNIVADAPMDWPEGRCYVPANLCKEAGITVDQLFDDGNRKKSRAALRVLINRAREHLADALKYFMLFPRLRYRERLFCLTPLFLALKTLNVVEADPSFPTAGKRPKITRRDVYRTLGVAALIAPSNKLAARYFKRLARSV
jgi:farnesyl-diphosphate farnesyltransferase